MTGASGDAGECSERSADDVAIHPDTKNRPVARQPGFDVGGCLRIRSRAQRVLVVAAYSDVGDVRAAGAAMLRSAPTVAAIGRVGKVMDQARIAGDIAMLAPEVNPVIAALRKNNLQVVALHSHMIGEEPRIIFLHYYGTGPAATLAQAAEVGPPAQAGKAAHQTERRWRPFFRRRDSTARPFFVGKSSRTGNKVGDEWAEGSFETLCMSEKR